jgi:hypothetical protein
MRADTFTRKASEKGRIRIGGLYPSTTYTVTVERAEDAPDKSNALPEGTRLVTDEELTWAEKPKEYWWSAKEEPRWRNYSKSINTEDWKAFNAYAIPTDTVLRPLPEVGYRHVTDEERKKYAKPGCARVWLAYPREWAAADSQGWKGKYNYAVPADHVWAEDAPKMILATDEVRRKYEMPKGAVYNYNDGTTGSCFYGKWDNDPPSETKYITYPANAVLVPRMIQATDETRRLYEMPEGAQSSTIPCGWVACQLRWWDDLSQSLEHIIQYPANAVLVPREHKWRFFRHKDGFVDGTDVLEYTPRGSCIRHMTDGRMEACRLRTLPEVEEMVRQGYWIEVDGPTPKPKPCEKEA